MYKIYINATPVYLSELIESEGLIKSTPTILAYHYGGKTKQLLQVIDMCEKTTRWEAIYIQGKSIETLWKDFKSLFKIIKAAGGVIQNNKAEILWIYRRDSWDFPKGKIDPGEKKKEAAIREVEEETGVKDVEIVKRLPDSYHTYRLKSGKRILKRTYWYSMLAAEQELIPQTEEDIELAVWKSKVDFLPSANEVYGNIMDTFNAFIAEDQ